MAYDLVILGMIATAIAGILYAQRETAKKGVRYIGQTRMPDRPVEQGNQPRHELGAPDLYVRVVKPNFSGIDAISVGTMASTVAVAKVAASIKDRTSGKYVVRMRITKKSHEEMLDERMRVEEERTRILQQIFEVQKIEAVRGIANDFSELLTVMLGSATLARYRLAPEDPLQESMRRIEHSAQRAAVLARRLVDFARPGSQQMIGATTDLQETVVKQEKILEYHGQAFDSMERRLRRLEEKAAQKRERATEEKPESDTESPILIN